MKNEVSHKPISVLGLIFMAGGLLVGVFFFFSIFYYLTIPVDNIMRLNSVLPEDPISGRMNSANKLFVKAIFKDKSGNYESEVKVRYRGQNANHWNSIQKSYRIEFPDDNYWNGQQVVNFIIPYDRQYYIEPVNIYRAKKFGLIDVPMEFVHLNLNGSDRGVYLMFEQWSPEFLAKKQLPEAKIFSLKDGIYGGQILSDYVNTFDEEGDVAKEELATLLELRDKADKDTFKVLISQIVDMEKLYRWNVINILAGSNHQNEAQNPLLYWNNVIGKFEIIPWDIGISDRTSVSYDDSASLLMSRILSIPEFRARRDQILREYVENSENLDDDLNFYDNLVKQTKTDFFKDNFKLYTNFTYLSSIKKDRQILIDNFESVRSAFDFVQNYEDFVSDKNNPEFFGSFSNFKNTVLGIDRFLFENYQFFKINQNTVGLSGSQIFYDDVVIPVGINFVIFPGSQLLLDSKVSIFSFGSVDILGTSLSPVLINKLKQDKSWGTFAVINAGSTSKIKHLNVSGGSGAVFNGIIITGMVAFHNSDVSIQDSRFSNSTDDDTLNIKMSKSEITNSIFSDTMSDAIDVDFSEGTSLINNNTFNNIGGDAIDLSFSKILIKGNKVKLCGDKGVSVGEASHPQIIDNDIAQCDIGIAVKDLSKAYISGSVLSGNNIGLSLYRKKQEFGGSTTVLFNNKIDNNLTNIEIDKFSKIIYEN